MKVITDSRELRAVRARLPNPLGFVPTMGALHGGHAALIERARGECASVVASIFVNPLQFGPNEDFSAYPRNLDPDIRLLEQLGVDCTFVPSVADMYPRQLDVFVEPTSLAQFYEGERRPGHFRGVATVVLKLLHLVEPQQAYFGEKDAQQLAVIKRMIADLDLPIDVRACPTVRDKDGVALSSRNAYLTAEQRRIAPNLNAALCSLAAALESGVRDIAAALAQAKTILPPLREDYIGVVRPDEFRPLVVAPTASQLLVIGAAYVGQTRLIDNVKVQTPAEHEAANNEQSRSR